MRHSDIGLTMNAYTDPRLLDISGAIDRLPDLPLDGSPLPVEKQAEVATGTDGKDDSPRRTLAPILAPTTDVSGVSLSIPDNTDADDAAPGNAKNAEKTSVFPAFLAERVTGVEPATTSLEG